MVTVYHFDSKNAGKKLIVLGAIHGDETCGQHAITRIIDKIEKDEIQIQCGSVTFIPICNEKAYQQHKRYCDKNLNRVFTFHENPTCYEEMVANDLITHIKKADYLVDLHSMHTNGIPFVFQDYDDEETQKFVIAQGLDYAFIGWTDLYSKNGVLQDSSTTDYAKSVNITAVTVECGSHTDPQAIKIAENCIMNSLAYLSIISQKPFIEPKRSIKFIKMKDVIYKKASGMFVNHWEHLNTIKKGTLIAEYDHGEKIIANYDGYIILPNHHSKLGDEWFYLGCAV